MGKSKNGENHNSVNKGVVLKGGLGRTLIIWFLCLSLIPMAVISFVGYRLAINSLSDASQKALIATTQTKITRINSYFSEMLVDLSSQTERPSTTFFLERLEGAYLESKKSLGDFVKSFKWMMLENELGGELKIFQNTYGYHDVLLMDTKGNILFTAIDRDNRGTNLFTGENKDSLFAAACRKSLTTGRIVFSDFEPNAPSIGGASGFLALAVLDESGDKIGIFALQFLLDSVNRVMRVKTGLGRTAEVYLVGPDLKLRSGRGSSGNKASLLDQEVDTEQIQQFKEWLDKTGWDDKPGVQGVNQDKNRVTDVSTYMGPNKRQVLGVLGTIDVAGVPFGVIAEITRDEAFASARQLGKIVFGLLALTVVIVIIIAAFISRHIVMPLRKLSESARQVTMGKLDQKISITAKNETGELAASFTNMLSSLRRSDTDNQNRAWINTGLSKLNAKVRGDLTTSQLSDNAIGFLARYLDVQVGLFYVVVEGGTLQLQSSYAFQKRKNLSNVFRFGEGLVGQAALEKTYLTISKVPDDYIRITSGSGEAVPRNILAYPMLYDGKVNCVLEFATLENFTDLQMELLQQAAEIVSIAIEAASARTHTKQLLTKTQAQSEELQSQQEELKSANEELEEQMQLVKESEQRLKMQQEELQTTNEELEEKTEFLEKQKNDIQDANTVLDQTKSELEEKAEELEISSKYKSQFLANMSHELRTPLNSLLLLSQSLEENPEGNMNADQVESAQVIHSSGNDLLELINEILDLSKIEAGQMDLHPANVSLVNLRDSFHTAFGHVAKIKDIEFKVHVDESAPKTVFSDRQRIEQIMKNFISNAIKFTDKGSIVVSFFRPAKDINLSKSRLLPDKTIGISVKDTGIGIAKEEQKIIFEAFQQVDGGTARKFGGTGLGLSISRELATLLEGEIQLESDTGKGAVFTLYLPEKLSRPGQSKALQNFTTPKPFSHGRPAKRRQISKQHAHQRSFVPDDRDTLKKDDDSILIIEDDKKFAKMLLAQCHDRGFKGLVSETGEEGLELALRYLPKAVILDIRLPGIDGWGVLTELKETPDIRHIPVHIMSVEEATIETFRKGAIGHLTKPATREDMEEAFGKLENIFKRKIKELLLVENDAIQRKSIITLLGNGDVHITEAVSGKEAFEALKTGKFDCMILDLMLPDTSGFKLLDKLEADKKIIVPPTIVYTSRDLSRKEELILESRAESIIIKGVRSEDRLLDETSLFLHRIVGKMPQKKRRIITNLHDTDVIFQNKKILIVDDDMRNVFALSRVLGEKGMAVFKADNGKKALEVLSQEPDIHMVLMDIMMPVMDGYETIKQIRSQDRYQNLPIIALTAKAMKKDRDLCMAAGANDYLAKPVDVGQLISMMRVWIYR